ncbi:hypothetical protein JB92DRAFT_3084729 [Gautieria morchelliformis]|nr:hypothetical protein JB92DRAFT_3084729 [Gautieria morchelliformis]
MHWRVALHTPAPSLTLHPRSLKQIRSAIPARLFVRRTSLGLLYTARDLLMAAVLCYAAAHIDPTLRAAPARARLTPVGAEALRWLAWHIVSTRLARPARPHPAAGGSRGLTFTGIWVIGHEALWPRRFSASKTVCDVLGYVLHTALWTPYFSWRISHHRHHSNHASMEKDEVRAPTSASQGAAGKHIDYDEYFGDTPIYTLFMLVRQQLLAFPAYLLFNVSGRSTTPANSIIFNPASAPRPPLQPRHLRHGWLVTYASALFGTAAVVKYYGVPWLCFIMITYLHHTDPRSRTSARASGPSSAAPRAPVDRDFLGWQGRFFLHDVAHYHVVHHFFPQMPFYHGAEATGYLRSLIGEHYAYSDAPVFRTLWENYNFCQFVEDEGDVVFYKNKQGHAIRRPAARMTVSRTLGGVLDGLACHTVPGTSCIALRACMKSAAVLFRK